jgi:hypothetical protein
MVGGSYEVLAVKERIIVRIIRSESAWSRANAGDDDHPMRAEFEDLVSDACRGDIPISGSAFSPRSSVRLIHQVNAEDVPIVCAQEVGKLLPGLNDFLL